jgi:hypothetical protein
MFYRSLKASFIIVACNRPTFEQRGSNKGGLFHSEFRFAALAKKMFASAWEQQKRYNFWSSIYALKATWECLVYTGVGGNVKEFDFVRKKS